MKKTYISDEVIELYHQYEIYCSNFDDLNPFQTSKLFESWLKDKEQSEVPVKDQLAIGQEIWVTNDDEDTWYKGKFIEFVSGEGGDVYASIQESGNTFWQLYSINDPNSGE